MGDAISRQDTINEIKNVFDDILCCNVSVRKGLPEAVRRIEMMPSAEPKTGKWKFIGDNMYSCTACCTCYTVKQFAAMRNFNRDPLCPKYCPSCGSFNGGEEE